jgi:hypothetical protein
MHTVKRLITLFCVLGSLGLFDTALGASSDDLVLQLSSGKKEQVDEALMMLYQRIENDDLLPLAWALWNEDKKKYPMFNWSLTSNDIFRIRLANPLGQWLILKDADRESLLPIKRYVIQQRNNQDPEVRLMAIGYTVYSDSCDLRFFVNEALREDGIFSAMALLSITRILGFEAKKTLQEIQSKIKSKELLEQIDRLMEMEKSESHMFQDINDYHENADCIL